MVCFRITEEVAGRFIAPMARALGEFCRRCLGENLEDATYARFRAGERVLRRLGDGFLLP